MRSSIAALGLFAAAAIAVPYKRDVVVTEVDVVQTVTDVVTVTAGEPVAATATSSVDAAVTGLHVDDKLASNSHWPSFFSHHDQLAAAVVPATSTAVATESSTLAAVTSSTSVYVAPTSTSVYVAPTTSSVYTPPTSAAASAWTSVSVIVETEAAAAPSAVQSVASAASQNAGSAAATVPALASVPSSYSDIAIYHHNIHRANHSAGPVEWDDNLASTAAVIASSCIYAHNTNVNGGGYGQNIAAGVASDNISSVITDLFYNGEVNYFNGLYGQAQPSMNLFENWGHFSQVVWNATTRVGCATQHCTGGLANTGSDVAPYFTVCNYAGAGNYANEYGSNIFAPLNMPTAQWNTGL